MLKTCNCNHIMTYRKSDPSEIIEVGDIIMLDPDTSYVKRAEANDYDDLMVNSRLIIGVCVTSNNTDPIPVFIDGGHAYDEDSVREELDSGTSDKPQTIMIISGDSDINKREIIQIAYMGEQMVNICGYVDLGDKLTLSEHPGKAKSKDFLDEEFYVARSIGKVIKFTNNPKQVKVLLDIE